jgi:hypothetical protein
MSVVLELTQILDIHFARAVMDPSGTTSPCIDTGRELPENAPRRKREAE